MKDLQPILTILLALLLLVPLASAAVDCSKDDRSGKPRPACFYDTPGGVKEIGPGREVIESYRTVFEDGIVLVKRQVEVVRLGAISYANPNSATTRSDVVVTYIASNRGKETIPDLEVEQPVLGGPTYKLTVGAVKAGKDGTASFSFPSETMPALPDPEITYTLASVSIKGAETPVNDKMELWLKVGRLPLAGEEVQVTTPSGDRILLLTEKSGKAEFVPREVGQYLVQVPRRELVQPFYIYVTQPYEPPEKAKEGGSGVGVGAISSFLLGGTTGALDFLGGTGLLLVVVAFAIGGWTYYRMRRPEIEDSAIVGGDVPSELARYGADQQDYAAGLPADATMDPEPLALSEEEKLKMMESTIMLSPKQRDDIHSREARKALGGEHPKKGAKKAKDGKEGDS